MYGFGNMAARVVIEKFLGQDVQDRELTFNPEYFEIIV